MTGDFLLLQGKEADGKDSIATQLAEQSHWEDLVIIIAVVSFSQLYAAFPQYYIVHMKSNGNRELGGCQLGRK